MFSIKGIDHIVLRTNRIEQMLWFYCDMLNCIIENQQPEIGLTQLRAGDNLIDLVSIDSQQPQGKNLEHFCLRVTPFDYSALEKHFKRNNIEPQRFGKRYGAQGMVYSFYISDPEGNEVEICELKQ